MAQTLGDMTWGPAQGLTCSQPAGLGQRGCWVGAACHLRSPVKVKAMRGDTWGTAHPSIRPSQWPYLGPEAGHAPGWCHPLHWTARARVPWGGQRKGLSGCSPGLKQSKDGDWDRDGVGHATHPACVGRDPWRRGAGAGSQGGPQEAAEGTVLSMGHTDPSLAPPPPLIPSHLTRHPQGGPGAPWEPG